MTPLLEHPRHPRSLVHSSQPVDPHPALESFSGTFEHLTGEGPRIFIVDGLARYDLSTIAEALEDDELLSIPQDRDVGVVGDDDDLPPLLGATERCNERAVDELAVEVVLGLIDEQRLPRVRGQHQGQQDGLLLAERQPLEASGDRLLSARGLGCHEDQRKIIDSAAFQPMSVFLPAKGVQDIAGLARREHLVAVLLQSRERRDVVVADCVEESQDGYLLDNQGCSRNLACAPRQVSP